jgi:hypothetical protein
VLFVLLAGACRQGQNHGDQERYNPPHHMAAIHPASVSISDLVELRA